MTEQSALRTAGGSVAVTTGTVLPVFLLGALVVQISAELGFAAAELGLVVSLYFGLSAVFSLPVGRLVERFGSRVTTRGAIVGAALSLLLTAAFARGLAVLVAILLCFAWCNVMGQLSTNLVLARSMPTARMGLSFGAKQACVPLATLLAGLAVPVVALTVGWRWAYVAAAVAVLATLMVAPRGEGPESHAPSAAAERATLALSVVGVAAGLGAASSTGLSIFLVASAVDRGVDPGTAGLVLTLGSVVAVVMRVGHGWLADRRVGGHVAMVALSLGLGALGVLVLALPGSLALVAGTVLGFGLGWSWPGLLQFAVVRLNPAAPAAATAVVQVGVYAGGCLGPLGFGLLAAGLSFTAAWIAAAAAMLVACGGVLVGRRLLVRHRDAQLRARVVTTNSSTSRLPPA